MTKQYLRTKNKLKNHASQIFLFRRKKKSFSMTKILEHSVTQPTEHIFFLKELVWVIFIFII